MARMQEAVYEQVVNEMKKEGLETAGAWKRNVCSALTPRSLSVRFTSVIMSACFRANAAMPVGPSAACSGTTTA